MEQHIFYFSLVTSFLVHSLIMTSFFYSQIHSQKKIPKDIEIVYQTEAQDIDEKSQDKPDVKSVKRRKWTPTPKILSKRDPLRSSVLKEVKKQPVKLKMHKKQASTIGTFSGKRHVSVPLLKSEKITNPRYLNYHETIRKKIKDRASYYTDDPDFQVGEVALSFIILANGELKKIKIKNNETSANDYLRSIGLRSIKESSPFPSFPGELKYPELSFNVVISFTVNE